MFQISIKEIALRERSWETETQSYIDRDTITLAFFNTTGLEQHPLDYICYKTATFKNSNFLILTFFKLKTTSI